MDVMWTLDRLRPRSPRMAKVLRRWEPVLGEQLDDAATVLASAQRRIPGLIPRLTVPSKAARGHLEVILPGAAVYLELSDRFGQDRARKLTATCLDARAERRARVLRLLDRTPWLFPVYRRSGRRMLQRDFSPPAFGVRWIEDSAQRMRFDMTRCYYLDTLTTLGIPELTGLCCHCDEVAYGGLNHLRFVRAGTLAQGCDRCDFCFERRPAGRQRSVQAAPP
jgi:L-2-amino-thiazoline-4-carboxylic acid hydrolase